MHDDRVSLEVRRLRTGERTALNAFAGILRGVLVGNFAHGEALKTNAEARFIHHDEHGGKALVLPANEASS